MDAFTRTDSLKSGDLISPRLAQRAAKNDFYFRPDEWVAGLIGRVENVLEEVLESDIPIMDVIGRHMLFGYAKRLRPTFTLLSQQLFNEEVLQPTVECAAAAELIHCASLFHDDVIDNASTRKGRRSANAVWGNNSAVIMGDRFFVLAYTLLARQRDFRILDIFVETCKFLAEGIMLEIKNTGNLEISENTHSDIITRKTAIFFRSVSVLGGYLAGASETSQEYLSGLGLNFGLAFQHSDDLLDLFADPEATGKPRGTDLRAGIYTTPIIYALRTNPDFSDRYAPVLRDGGLVDDEIEEIADLLRNNGAFDYVKGLVNKYSVKALGYLDKLPGGRANETLRMLITRIVEREY